MKGIDFFNLFLIVFISYCLLRGNRIIEGVTGSDSSGSSSGSSDSGSGSGSGVKCQAPPVQGSTTLSEPEKEVDCTRYPLEYKDNFLEINQCVDGSYHCEDREKELRCCNSRTEICQGNLDPSKDITCDDGSWPKVDSSNTPPPCRGLSNDSEDCWMHGKPPLSSLSHDKQQTICCTSRSDFLLAEKFWGIPYLISKASKKYDDSKLLRTNDMVEDADKLLHSALELLYEARNLDTGLRYSNIPTLIRDWGIESGHTLGSGMCSGNIDIMEDVDCSVTNQEFIEDPFLKVGNSSEDCCVISGMCSGNTNPVEDITCPEGTVVKTTHGTSVSECCEGRVTCRGNANINLNFNCPPPLVPVSDATTKIASTKEECCRHPEDKTEAELKYVSTNETISGTLIINADLLSLAGLEGSSKRALFINNFKKDISNHINASNKINILPSQIIINKIYKGSIVIEFKVIPDDITGVSITKEYFSYLFSKETLLPTIGNSTAGGITNVKIISWYNIEHWPEWIWYVIVSSLTFIIAFAIFV